MTPQWAWASHQPLIQGVLDLYKPDYALEIGIGLYSTPLFLDAVSKYRGIEQDRNWMNKLNVATHPDASLCYHDLKGLTIAERYWSLNAQQKYDIVSFYHGIKEDVQKQKGTKVLFVDCYTCSRMYAVNALWSEFDIIMYHDSQPRVRHLYGYDKLQIKGYTNYQLASKLAWTGLFVKNDIGLITLQNTITSLIKMFDVRWKVNAGMKVIKG